MQEIELMYIWLPLLSVLAVAAIIDLFTLQIPNFITITSMLYFLAMRFVIDSDLVMNSLFGLAAGGGFLILINFFRPNAIGGGDIKLMGTVGAAIGLKAAVVFLPLLFLFAFVFVKLHKLATRQTLQAMPFAPFFFMSGLSLFVLIQNNF